MYPRREVSLSGTDARRAALMLPGCYECSQRRIHCDNAQPTCLKCASRGIRCSGYGVRYRFKADLGARANPIPTDGPRYSAQNPTLGDPDLESSRSLDWAPARYRSEDHDSIDRDESFSISDITQIPEPVATDIWHNHESEDDPVEEVGDPLHSRTEAEAAISGDLLLGSREPWKQYFLNYCEYNARSQASILTSPVSQRIAAEMVLVDDHQNGWRNLVLPLARQDALVEDTVLSVAAFHFSMNVDDRFLNPTLVYQRAIRRLRSRQDVTSYDIVRKQSVLLSLLVLLVAAVVSGSSDFRTIFGLLEACLQALGGEESISHGELGTFLVWQIHK
jgi:hypothetical protein